VQLSKGTRVTLTRGKLKGTTATVEGTDRLGRYILRSHVQFAPLFVSPESVTVAADRPQWHRGTDHLGRSCYYLAGTSLLVVKVERYSWMIRHAATNELRGWGNTLTEAKAEAEKITR
jgi:hypothetical protein